MKGIVLTKPIPFCIIYTYSYTERCFFMKFAFVVIMALTLSACGTVGGAVSGAGQDLSKAGEWIKNR
jgi:predicted small secreted protein